ncbi:ornithine cyclodeaminase family protein [Acrocarpospora sp. B8E8]|uniref:ornithine cyclodeaminase family protein n=1 Tax=Acrocarpospora sp. B8E8 TaxID=3153572 RepID=UPI00325DF68A
MTRFLTEADIRAVFDWHGAIAALRAAYSAPTDDSRLPPRSMARTPGGWLRTLTGVLPGGEIMGAKLIAASTVGRRATYLIPLFDQRSTELLALLDGSLITGFRTAATSALAIDAMSPAGALRAAVIGSGFEAQQHVRALAAARELAAVTVFSPNPASRLRFVESLSDLDVPIGTASGAEAAVAGADVVVCAARSRDERPTLHGAWLEAGMTVVSIGSTLPEQRELDEEAIGRADLIVADQPDEVAHQTGDLIAARNAGASIEGKLFPLHDVLSGRAPGRPSPEAIVLYKSVGSALQDLAVAAMCLQRAQERELGTILPVRLSTVVK